MENTESSQKTEEIKPCLPKLATRIRGLDKILYGGFDINQKNIIIVIKGNMDIDKTLLGLQILYGIAQSIEKVKKEYDEFCPSNSYDYKPAIYSSCYKEDMLHELFLDNFISSGMQEILKKKATKEPNPSLCSNNFANILFDCNNIICKNYSSNSNIPYSTINNKIDSLIGDGIVIYNNRTNSLHYNNTQRTKDDKSNQIYRRKYDNINEYCNHIKDNKLYEYTGQYFIPLNINDNNYNAHKLIAVDISDRKYMSKNDLTTLFDSLEKPRISILIVDNRLEFPEYRANIIIDLSSKINHNFEFKYLHIIKSDIQDFLPGLQQYKKRDYGIEVYPRLTLYIYKRRYLQRALAYTHSDALTETFQQYQERQKYYFDSPNNAYEEYEEDLKKKQDEQFQSIYPKDHMEILSIDLLNKIFMPFNPLKHLLHKTDHDSEFMKMEYMYGNASFVTAIIGRANTYKRFLTFGGIFGSASMRDHTLIIMMNKEETVIRRRLTCPARSRKEDGNNECKACYRYIHFMNICMGNITPEEFLYYLERQIEVTYEGETQKRIRRIVIDDLQILDFCFPRLKDNGLFLAALAELCRQNNIILYILCDVNGNMYPALRALADNVVFTDKDEKGAPLIYVEKFAGYTNTPSKMYCGRVRNVSRLFRCMENYDSKNIRHIEFQTNIIELEDVNINKFRDFEL